MLTRNGWIVPEETRRTIVEIARVFLEAGSPTDDCSGIDPLYNLIYSALDCLMLSANVQSALVRGSDYQMYAELTELFLQYGVDSSKRGRVYTSLQFIFKYTYLILKTFEELRLSGATVSLDTSNTVINSLAHMFRISMLSQATKNTYAFTDESFANMNFAEDFALIAGYSYQPGHSRQFIHLVLNTMSVGQLNELKCMLSRELRSMTETDQLRASTIQALELVQGVETPFSLQHLARSFIIRATPCKYLCGASLNFSIPKVVEQYIKLHD